MWREHSKRIKYQYERVGGGMCHPGTLMGGCWGPEQMGAHLQAATLAKL